MSTGEHNALTDVVGIRVGQHTDREAASGVTVILVPEGAVAGVDIRGSAPGTRETDLLDPVNLVGQVHAVCLSGGSVYGLAAADGVVRWLSEQGAGFPLEPGRVAPIVPAAVLFDLGRGREYVPPIDAQWGRAACENASTGPVEMGSVGAGTGAHAGGIKGGVGSASVRLPSGLTVGALAVVNALGSVLDPDTGRPWELRLERGREFGRAARRAVTIPSPPGPRPAGNTTLGVVATDGELSKAQACKVAQMAQDGLARAIRPAHTMFDGDTVFCVGTGRKPLPATPGFFAAPQAQAVTELGQAAADCLSRAVIRAVLSATTLAGATAHRDLEDRP